MLLTAPAVCRGCGLKGNVLLLHGGGEEGCSIYLGVVKFPAVDPPAVGADISMGTRIWCLLEMQRRNCFLGLES